MPISETVPQEKGGKTNAFEQGDIPQKMEYSSECLLRPSK